MVVPTTEMGVDPIGNIAELPTTETNADPFSTPESSAESSPTDAQPTVGKRRSGDPSNLVTSWAQYNSMGNRNLASRLSQPHAAPDGSVAVWSNLSPVENKEEFEKNEDEKQGKCEKTRDV